MQKRDSTLVFYSVVKALFFREIQTRFGAKHLGYLWAIIDPMAKILVFSWVKMFVSSRTGTGYDFPVFLATSFLAYDLFANITKKSMTAFEANEALFVYKQVRPFDTIVVRFIVEWFVMILVTLPLIMLGFFLGYDLTVAHFNLLIAALIWFSLFGLGLGILFAVIGTFYENFKKVVNLLFLPLFFLSALFYTVDSLPPLAREYLLYNPVVHFIEMVHGNYFSALNTTNVDYRYILLWTLIPLFAGLYLYRRSEKGIIAT